MNARSRISTTLLRGLPALFCIAAFSRESHADPVMSIPCSGAPTYTYSLQINTSIGAPAPTIGASGVSYVKWSASPPSTGGCSAFGTNWNCAGMTVSLPSGNPAPVSDTGSITTAAAVTSLGSQSLFITAKDGGAGATQQCVGNFTFRVTSSGGGWGDPHLTTVDGVNYDFQSAGEFTALREEGLTIQTRQSPVPTATVPITNAYTGITHCVSIYTAVAAKLGSTRVTVQPSPGAEPDPKGMQVRVNGKLVTLGEAPLVLRSEGTTAMAGGLGGKIDGTLTKHADGNIEITDSYGTQLVVTPDYWASQKVWYLNVNVYGTTAHEGTMGSIAKGSWLPALPGGGSVGPKPESASERYQVLYEKFADAWRVTNETSLFDYEPGTNTATFTRDEWPRNNPQSCAIEGQPSAQAATEQNAEQACANLPNGIHKADCVFDVKVTGNAQFGKTYEGMRKFGARTPGWYTPVLPPSGPTTTPPSTTPPSTTPSSTPCPPCSEAKWCTPLVILLTLLVLILLVILLRRSKN